MGKHSQNIQSFILHNSRAMTAAEMARKLGIKERKVRKILAQVEAIAGRDKARGNSSAGRHEGYSFCWIVVLILLVFGFLIYGNTLGAFFQLDDHTSILKDYSIHSLRSIGKIWERRPATFISYLTFALNYQWSGLQPWSYHLVNLLIHVASAWLVFLFARDLFDTGAVRIEVERNELPQSPKDQNRLALFTALIFLAHPIQTEAVTYIVQRNTSLATFFYLGALVSYAKARLSGRIVYWVLALLSTLLGFFTKQITYTIPISMAVYEIYFLSGENGNALKRIKRALPFVCLLGIVYFAIYHHEVMRQGFRATAAETSEISRKTYLLTESRVLVTYLRLLFLPFGQNLDYDYPLSPSVSLPVAACFGLLLGVMGMGVWLYRCGNRIAAFGIAWFFITLSIESSIIPIRDVIFEHRLYLPMTGFALIVSSSLWCVLRSRATLRLTVFILLLAVLGILTYQRNRIWASETSLWTDVVGKSPQKSRAANNLGGAYQRLGDFVQASAWYEKALKLDPKNVEAYINLGMAAEHDDDYPEARRNYEKAIEVGPKDGAAFSNLGRLYIREGDYDEAIPYFEKALEKDSLDIKSMNNLAYIYDQKGDLDKEIALYEKAVRIDPQYTIALKNLGIAYGRKGNYPKSIETLLRARQLDPRDGEIDLNLGISYAMDGRTGDALFLARSLRERGRQRDAERIEAALAK
jgi:tetratricopeptide (TPR) repeat protein